MRTNLVLKGMNISHAYNHHLVLKQINCQFERNSLTVIKGKSGSGKSTLLYILSGLESPQNGSVLYENQSIHTLSEKKQAQLRGKEIGFIFQEFHLIPDLTVKQNMLLPIELNNIHIEENELVQLCKKLDLLHLMHEKIRLLSGGEKQRVAIGRALLKKPKILFADEPTGNLDSANTESIVQILQQLILEQQITLVVVTHEKSLFHIPHAEFELVDGILKESSNYD